MFKQIRVIAALILCAFKCAANTNDDINAYRDEGLQRAASVPSDTIKALKINSEENQSAHRLLIDEFLKNAHASAPTNKPVQAVNGAILFVSFSMPQSLLFALADEAAEYNIPVVINGLVDNDFKKTIETFSRLNKEAKKQRLNFKGLSIDPVWFQQFQITTVPALVVSLRPASCEAETICPDQPFDVVYGNASLKKGLELIAEKGDAATGFAKTILEHGHV